MKACGSGDSRGVSCWAFPEEVRVHMLSVGVSVCPFYQVDRALLSPLGGVWKLESAQGKWGLPSLTPSTLTQSADR